MELFRFLFLVTCLLFAHLGRASGQMPTATPDQSLVEIQQLIQRGNLTEARSLLTQAIQRFPSQASFFNFLGVIDAQEKRYRQAETNFRKSISLTPQYEGPYINLGRLYQENQTTDPVAARKAIEVYESLLKVDPGHVEAHYQLAVLMLPRGEFKGSLENISKLPEAVQSRPQVVAIRCGSLAGSGRLVEAEAVAREWLSNPDLNEVDLLPVLPVLENKKLDSLQALLLEGLSAKGAASVGSLHQLGLVYERLGQLEKSRAILEKVAERQTISAGLLLELTRLAYKQKDNKGALGYLAHARDLEPRNAAIYFFWGIVCMEEDLGVEALKALKEAVNLDPNNAFAQYALGEMILRTREPTEAVTHFQKFCELRPQEPQGQYAVAVAYYASGNYAEAQRLMELMAGNPRVAAGANFYLARLAKQEGNLDETLRRVELAVKANDQAADSWAEMGQIRLRRREWDLALGAFQKSIGIDPDNYLANLNLLVVYQRTKDPRQEAQAQRFEEVRKKRSEKEQLQLTKIEIRPY